jgi:L-fuculose-phosphate aldolase
MVATAQSLREQVAWACRILALEGYADLTLGHVSGRLPGEHVVHIKRKGVALDEVEAADVVELDLEHDGVPMSPDMHLEAVLHSEVYRRRPDVGAVVHGHPPYATAIGATEASLELLTHDSVLFADGVAVYEESPELITDVDQGRAVAKALGRRRAIVLRNHGVLVAGKDIPWAVLTAVTLERAVRLQSIARTLGELRPIPGALAERMWAEKYQDRFVDEYWAAWIRRVRRAGADRGMDPG